MARKKVPGDYEFNKQKIIQVSIDLMVRGSISNFNLNKVADKLGITKAAIYWYYPSKEALIEEIAQFTYKRYTEYAGDVANCGLSPREKLRKLLSGSDDTYESVVMCMFPVKFFLEYSGSHTIRELIQKGYAEFYKSVKQIIKEGVNKGEFKTDLPLDDLTIFISGAVDGLAFQNIVLSDENVTVPRRIILNVLEKILVEEELR